MNEIIKLLDKSLKYINHEIKDGIIFINIESINKELTCPYYKQLATKRHSTYIRTLQYLPIQDKKVILIIHNKKMFCENKNCTKKLKGYKNIFS